MNFFSCSSLLLQLPNRGPTLWSQTCAPLPPFSPLPFPSPHLINSPSSEMNSSSSSTSTSDGRTAHISRHELRWSKLSHSSVLLLLLFIRCYSPKTRRRESGTQSKKVKTHWKEEKKTKHFFWYVDIKKSTIEHFTNGKFYWKWRNRFVQIFKQLEVLSNFDGVKY